MFNLQPSKSRLARRSSFPGASTPRGDPFPATWGRFRVPPCRECTRCSPGIDHLRIQYVTSSVHCTQLRHAKPSAANLRATRQASKHFTIHPRCHTIDPFPCKSGPCLCWEGPLMCIEFIGLRSYVSLFSFLIWICLGLLASNVTTPSSPRRLRASCCARDHDSANFSSFQIPFTLVIVIVSGRLLRSQFSQPPSSRPARRILVYKPPRLASSKAGNHSPPLSFLCLRAFTRLLEYKLSYLTAVYPSGLSLSLSPSPPFHNSSQVSLYDRSNFATFIPNLSGVWPLSCSFPSQFLSPNSQAWTNHLRLHPIF